MANVTTLVDRVKIFTLSSGTGPFVLGPAVSAYRGSEALVDGNRYSYTVEQGSSYEAGTAEYVLSTNSLIRNPDISSNGGAPVPFTASAQVSFTALASDFTFGDASALRVELASVAGATMIGTSIGSSVQTVLNTKATIGAVGSSGLTMTTARILGRWAAATGAVQEVTIGTGLALSGSGVLTATGSATATWGGIIGTLSAQTDLQTALTARALTGAIGSSGLTQATARLLGRWSASPGPVQEVTIGAGLALDGSGNLGLSGSITTSGLTMNAARMLARTTAGAGAPEELTDVQGRAFLGVFDNASGTYTPTVTSLVGTITSKSATGLWVRTGKNVTVWIRVSITTNGTGDGAVFATLPFTAATTVPFAGGGRETAVGGKGLAATVEPTGAMAYIANYDNSYPGSNGAVLNITLSYLLP